MISSSFPSDWDGDIIPQRIKHRPRVFRVSGGKEGMNQKIVQKLLKQLQQENQDPKDIGKLNIANVIIWMKKEAYEKTTIQRVVKELKHLERNCNTAKPEIKLYVANKTVSNARKENLIESYNIAIQSLGLQWNKPFYERHDKKRRAPKEESVQFIINHVHFPLNLKLKMSRDLGERPIELTWLKVQDIDLATGKTDITGAKHTIGREGQLKTKSLELLRIVIKKKNLIANSHIYNGTSDNLANDYRHYRNRIADEYDMPELKQIKLYDFRRFKASKTYHLTNNLLLVKQLLGHKHVEQTEHYISLFDEKSMAWIPVICHNQAEIEQAIKDDRILVCQSDGITFFKKPA
jgi:integrase